MLVYLFLDRFNYQHLSSLTHDVLSLPSEGWNGCPKVKDIIVLALKMDGLVKSPERKVAVLPLIAINYIFDFGFWIKEIVSMKGL